MVVQCGLAISQNNSAAFTAGANDPLAGSVGMQQFGAQTRKRSQSHHRFVRSGRSRNPTRGSVGFTRGLSTAGARSTSEFVSRPPNSLARPSCIFLGVVDATRSRDSPWKHGETPLTCNGRPRRRGLCIRAAAPRAPRKGRSRGSPRLPLHETKFFRWEGS